ncbi:MAG: hypothetical protein DME65_11600 [Verrucomicrobia bacterium]|nr:MAG: hypothetical protein DME65_11600 [Verrucomicrobiota bacterium]
MLLETLRRHWWVPVIRGIAAIIFGIMAFAYPGLTVATLVLFFGAWVLIDGIFRVVGAIGHHGSDPDWGWHLIIGIVGIVVGLLTFHAPQITALALIIYIAAWALMIGASEIVLAIKMRREIKGEWFLILMGLASLVFAVLLLWNPIAGAAAVIWLIAWYAVVFGILAIFFGSDDARLGGFPAFSSLRGHSLRRGLFFCATTRVPAGLFKKIRLGAIDWAITLRRNMDCVLRVEFETPRIPGLLIVYEENCLCSPPPISQ